MTMKKFVGVTLFALAAGVAWHVMGKKREEKTAASLAQGSKAMDERSTELLEVAGKAMQADFLDAPKEEDVLPRMADESKEMGQFYPSVKVGASPSNTQGNLIDQITGSSYPTGTTPMRGPTSEVLQPQPELTQEEKVAEEVAEPGVPVKGAPFRQFQESPETGTNVVTGGSGF